MVPSRCAKSEYMKRFKEPKWEACGPCYQELLRYRLSRRLLEQAHRPWFWDGWEDNSLSSSGSSGSSSSPPGTSSPPAALVQSKEAAAAAAAASPGEAEEAGDPRIGASAEEAASSPAGPLRRSEDDDQEKAEIDQEERKLAVKRIDKPTSLAQQPSSSNRSVLGGHGERRRLKSPQRTDPTKETRHPFALYGCGEKQTDTGSQKTHNVCASASENEIHESALRAKNRRQVEKRKLTQRQIRSAEVERQWRVKPSGPDNPWVTEYMRCYSARAR